MVGTFISSSINVGANIQFHVATECISSEVNGSASCLSYGVNYQRGEGVLDFAMDYLGLLDFFSLLKRRRSSSGWENARAYLGDFYHFKVPMRIWLSECQRYFFWTMLYTHTKLSYNTHIHSHGVGPTFTWGQHPCEYVYVSMMWEFVCVHSIFHFFSWVRIYYSFLLPGT